MVGISRFQWKVLLLSLSILGALVLACLVMPVRRASPQASGRLERVVENPGNIEFSASADPAPRAGDPSILSHYWTARELRRSWTPMSGSGLVTWRSPRLEYDSLDEIYSLTIKLSPETHVRNFNLHWGDDPGLSPLVLGRNNRALTYPESAGTDNTLLVLGQDISATQELDAARTSPRYFFLRFESEEADHLPFESIQILSRKALFALQPYGLTRYDLSGHIRDSLYTAIPGEIIYRTSVPSSSYLSFGVHSLVRGAAVRYTLRAVAAGTSVTFFDRTIKEEGEWHDFRVAIPSVQGDIAISFRAESGVQENTAFWASPRIVPETSARQTNIVLYVADALRADRLGLYGYARPVSPFLDQLARRGVVFVRGYSAASWTKPSVASLLTSLYPQTHGVGLRSNTDILPESALTLQDQLRSRGYVTAHLSANPLGSTLSNLDQGFDSVFTAGFFERPGERPPKVRSDAMIDLALEWINDHLDEPFFLYIHAMDTHGPYSRESLSARLPVEATDDSSSALYDAEVYSSDQQIRRLYEYLTAQGLADNTLFIVTSDHGEAFGEHGRTGHGTSVYEEEIRVPLLMIHQGSLKPERIEDPVSLIDVMPTLLGYRSSLFEGTQSQGLNILSRPERQRNRVIVATKCIFPESRSSSENEVFAVIQRNAKLIVEIPRDARSPAFELYDLADDPFERRNLAAVRQDLVKSLYSNLLDFLDAQKLSRGQFVKARAAAEERRRTLRGIQSDSIPHDVLQRLRTLGYIR